MMVLCCQPAPGGAECSCIAWFPPPPPPRPTYLQSTLMEMVNCGTVTLQSAAELTQGQCTHMHMFNYTICTHCEECSDECEIDGLCHRFQLCREAVLPPRIVRSKCRAAAASPWTRQPPPSPPSAWTPPWWSPAPATRSSSWTSTGP